jgi:signal transduction histidine kinase
VSLSLADWISSLAALPEPAALVSGERAAIEAANTDFASLLDNTEDELVGRDIAGFVERADRPALLTAIAAGAEASGVEVRMLRPPDGERTIALNFGAVFDGGRRLVLAREVKAEERSERKLLQYFRDAIDSVGHMVAIFDVEDRMIAYNRNYREGYRVGDRDLPPHVRLEGKTYRECMELRAKYKLHREFLDQPQKFVEDRMRQHNQDNDQTITLANGQTLKVEKRTLPDGVRVIVGTDITEIAEGERKRRDLEAQLHHSQKLEALGTLAGGITHDLNNTLVPIVALSKAMARRLPDGSRDRTSLELIVQAADRARDLAGRILAFSRKETVERKLVNLGQVVGQGVKLLRSLVPTTIDLDSQLAPVPPVMGDPGQLYQILVNLVSNASRAIGTGPGTITVRMGCDSAMNDVTLAVADTGCGMDEATRRRIFEPFYTTRKVGEGTGLGLSVVYGIVTSHGGRIDVKSTPGQGTTFTIHLPGAGEMTVREAPAA